LSWNPPRTVQKRKTKNELEENNTKGNWNSEKDWETDQANSWKQSLLMLLCKGPVLQSGITGTWLVPVITVSNTNFPAYAGHNFWGTKHKISSHFTGSDLWSINFPTKWLLPWLICHLVPLSYSCTQLIFEKYFTHQSCPH
jgi:hypothetical protein